MANILFISVNDFNASGIRILSSYLWSQGHKTSVIFLKQPGYPISRALTDDKRYLREAEKIKSYDWVGVEKGFQYVRHIRGPKITTTEKEILAAQIEKIAPDLIGFSVTVSLIRRIAGISKYIKKNFSIPIIWGGPGATVDPEGCVDHCDFVCVGEGENTIKEIAEKINQHKAFHDVNNLCYKVNNRIIKNPLNPLITDLDALPFMDINPQNKFLIEDDGINEHFSKVSYSDRYHMIGSRGCPNHCSYCSENYYKKLYSPERFIRRRSPKNVVSELKEALKIINFNYVQFEDEVFSLDYEWLEEFSDLYLKDIKLPFTAYIFPKGNLDKQLSILKKSGLDCTNLALQSGSEKINKDIYLRYFNRERFLEIARKLESLEIIYYTDVIVDNIFEDEDDLKTTLDMLLQINPVIIYIAKLYVIKNTALSRIFEKSHKSYKMNQTPHRINRYYTRLFWLTLNDKRFVKFCQRIKVFKLFPSLLDSDWLISIIKYFLRLDPFSNRQLKKWKQILINKRTWFERLGIRYLLVATPNRHAYYPENIFDYLHKIKRTCRFDQLLEYLKRESDFEILDLRNRLRERTFCKNNVFCASTNNKGSEFCDEKNLIIKRMAEWFPEEETLKEELAEKKLESYKKNKSNLIAIILQNSYYGTSTSYFIKDYINVKTKHNPFSPKKLKRLIDQEKPAIVIEAQPERFFDVIQKKVDDEILEDFFNASTDSLISINQNNFKTYIGEKNQLTVSAVPDAVLMRSGGGDPYFVINSPESKFATPLIAKVIITSPSKTTMMIYYRTQNVPYYNEDQSELKSLKKGINTCFFSLSAHNLIAPLRFDPGRTPGDFLLHSFEVRSQPIHYTFENN